MRRPLAIGLSAILTALVLAGGPQRADGAIGFRVGDYHAALPLVVDPVLGWTTLLGGSSRDALEDMVSDAAGNVYVCGFSSSPDYPATAGAAQPAIAGSTDTIVTKLDPNGSIVWSTFLGGSSWDYPSAIAVDAQGRVYVTGFTGSTDFPVVGGLSNPAASSKAFVVQLAADGSTLLWSTFVSATGRNWAEALKIDAAGKLIVAGYADSGGLAPTPGVVGPTAPGGLDVFVVKWTPGASSPDWATYIGGTGSDFVLCLGLTSDGAIVAGGGTDSSDFPMVGNGYDRTLGGPTEGFLAKLSPDATSLAWTTYVGGSGRDAVYSIALDSTDSVHIIASTESVDIGVTPGAFGSSMRGTSDAWLGKLSADASTVLWATYLGGSGAEVPYAVRLDPSSDVIVCGATNSTDFPLAGASVQTAAAGGYDGFVAHVGQNGTTLLWSSYLGASGSDEAHGLVLTPAGELYVAGTTEGSGLPGASGPSLIWDGFVMRFTGFPTAPPPPPPPPPAPPSEDGGKDSACQCSATAPGGGDSIYAVLFATLLVGLLWTRLVTAWRR